MAIQFLDHRKKYISFKDKVHFFVAILKNNRKEDLKPEMRILRILLLSTLHVLLGITTFKVVIGNDPLPQIIFLTTYYSSITVNILLMLLPVWVNWKLNTGTEIHSLHHNLKMIDETRQLRDEAKLNREKYSHDSALIIKPLKHQEETLFNLLSSLEHAESQGVFNVPEEHFKNCTVEEILEKHKDLQLEYKLQLSNVKALFCRNVDPQSPFDS